MSLNEMLMTLTECILILYDVNKSHDILHDRTLRHCYTRRYERGFMARVVKFNKRSGNNIASDNNPYTRTRCSLHEIGWPS